MFWPILISGHNPPDDGPVAGAETTRQPAGQGRGSHPQKGDSILCRSITPPKKPPSACVCQARVLQLRKQGLLDAYSHGEKGSKSKFYFRAEDVEHYKQSRDNPEQPPLRKVSTRETD